MHKETWEGINQFWLHFTLKSFIKNENMLQLFQQLQALRKSKENNLKSGFSLDSIQIRFLPPIFLVLCYTTTLKHILNKFHTCTHTCTCAKVIQKVSTLLLLYKIIWWQSAAFKLNRVRWCVMHRQKALGAVYWRMVQILSTWPLGRYQLKEDTIKEKCMEE